MVAALTSLLGVGLVSLPSTTLGPAGGPSVTLPRLPDPGQIWVDISTLDISR